MTTVDESPTQEVRSLNQGFLGPQTTIRLGAWNVRTMFETSKTAQVINEMQNYNLDLPCVSECRWTGSGRMVTRDGSIILFSGKENVHSNGVALIANRHAVRSLMEWEPISDRLIRAKFASNYCNLTILQCYAPTIEAEAKFHNMICYWKPETWMLRLGMITAGGRIQWGRTAVEPSTITERGLLNFVLATVA